MSDERETLELAKLEREIALLDEQVSLKASEAALKVREYEQVIAQPGEGGEFWFYAEVGYPSVLSAMKMMSNWSNRYPGEDITVIFDSPGGYVMDGLHLFDFLQSLRAAGHHLTTKAYGEAASMGGVLLQAGDVRVMSPNSFLLLHEVSGGAGGKLSEQQDQLAFSKRLQAKCLDILAERSTLSVRQVETRWKKTDWWLEADEALKLGFVDEVGL